MQCAASFDLQVISGLVATRIRAVVVGLIESVAAQVQLPLRLAGRPIAQHRLGPPGGRRDARLATVIRIELEEPTLARTRIATSPLPEMV